MISHPGKYRIKVITSPLNTDHKAIVASTDTIHSDLGKRRWKVPFRRRSPDQHSSLLYSLRTLKLEYEGLDNPQEAWNRFYADITGRLERFYPNREVTLTSKDPDYMTPEIKSLLRKKNKLV